jgi:hypothetical protein
MLPTPNSEEAQRLLKYAEYACSIYVQAVQDQAEIDKQELATLIRQPEFYRKVEERAIRNYDRDVRADRWAKEALPKLNIV